MNFAFNRIKFNRQVAHFIGKEGKKKIFHQRSLSFVNLNQKPEKDPFPSWKFIAFISSIGLYHQYIRQIK